MRQLHREDLWSWSAFDTDRDIDFNSFAWIRPDGNVLVDPIPLIPHDREQLEGLGGASLIVITTGYAVANNMQAISVLGLSPLGVG